MRLSPRVGEPLVYLPLFAFAGPVARAVVSGGVISEIDIKWYLRNDAGTYDEVTDVTMFGLSASLVTVDLTDYSGTVATGGARIDESISLGSTSGYILARPSNTWMFLGDSSTTSPVADVITITYVMKGLSFRFEWR